MPPDQGKITASFCRFFVCLFFVFVLALSCPVPPYSVCLECGVFAYHRDAGRIPLIVMHVAFRCIGLSSLLLGFILTALLFYNGTKCIV